MRTTHPLTGRTLVAAALVVAACGTAAETIERTLSVGARERSYEIDLPTRRQGVQKLPAVIVFHGGGGSADSVRRQSRMSAKGEAEGFIVVYPQGSGGIAGKLKDVERRHLLRPCDAAAHRRDRLRRCVAR